MSNNRETRVNIESVHILLALQRDGSAKDKKCLRQVIKDEEIDLKILEAKCMVMGGKWRIHRTVNARNCEMARKILIKNLIDYPEKAPSIDAEWRTALMQKECRVTNYFMLDVDTKDDSVLNQIIEIAEKQDRDIIIQVIESPKGRHIITKAFDTREVCNIPDVTLLRDGYHFIKEIVVAESE